MSSFSTATDLPSARRGWGQEILAVWRQMPSRWVLVGLLGAWVAVFHWLGNSTLGYTANPSLFGWWYWVFTRMGELPDGTFDLGAVLSADEAYAWFIPLVTLWLLWSRREELVALPKKVSWWGLGFLAVAALIHVAGYMVQQPRVSLLGFIIGLYSLSGLIWGGGWMRATLFPFGLLLFCMPIGMAGEFITFPLRLLATKITAVLCQVVLGINIVREGTLLFDASRTYQYEVAAACSGIRSLTAILAFAVIYAYLNFNSTWRRLLLVVSGFPLAIIANVFRLVLIILAAEAFGQKAGDFVHTNAFTSLLPYVPAVGGLLLLGWWLREQRAPKPPDKDKSLRMAQAGQRS
ncbi:MAG TPA: exosortase/archaeosortase family protein [Verrucomicrobiae bacterium]|nr:exosortase/archaeosortase family protein [Verrucomicrobiae bacterium]